MYHIMKKFLSLVCVLALALAVCVPALAEEATSGQVAPAATSGEIAAAIEKVAANPKDYAAARSLYEMLKDQPSSDGPVYSAMKGAIEAAPNAKTNFTDLDDKVFGAYSTLSVRHVSGSDVNTVLTNTGNNTLKLEANFGDGNGYSSELGAVVQITLHSGLLSRDCAYMWVNDAGQTGPVEFMQESYVDVLEFYAPHFSTYTIQPVPSAPAPAAPILARTDSDLNMTAALLAALALVLTAGCAVVLKKRALNK